MSDYFNLPKELFAEILLKLPIQDLGKFTAVCKSWNSFIKTPTFISTRLNRTISSTNTNLLFFRLCTSKPRRWPESPRLCLRYSLRFDNKALDEYKKLPCPKIGKCRRFRVAGSINGLVCLVYDMGPYDYTSDELREKGHVYEFSGKGLRQRQKDFNALTFILWNPVIKKAIHLPEPARYGSCILLNLKLKFTLSMLIFWRSITSIAPKYPNNHGNSFVILAFDVSDEVFSEIPLPDNLSYVPDVGRALLLKYGESSIATVNWDWERGRGLIHLWDEEAFVTRSSGWIASLDIKSNHLENLGESVVLLMYPKKWTSYAVMVMTKFIVETPVSFVGLDSDGLDVVEKIERILERGRCVEDSREGEAGMGWIAGEKTIRIDGRPTTSFLRQLPAPLKSALNLLLWWNDLCDESMPINKGIWLGLVPLGDAWVKKLILHVICSAVSYYDSNARQRMGHVSDIPAISVAESAHNRCIRKNKQMCGMPVFSHVSGDSVFIVESEQRVSVPQLGSNVLHPDLLEGDRVQSNHDCSAGCAELLCASSVPQSGCAVTALMLPITNMTGLDSDFGIPGAVCGDDSSDQFWETALAQYQQILTHHNDLIHGVALDIEHILSGGSQLPIVGKADAASNRFRTKLYLANEAHTVYRQHHRMHRFGQALQSRSKVFNHLSIRSTVTSEGDIKTLKRVQCWSDDVRLSILSRFSDSTFGFICDHTAGTSDQSLRPQRFVSTRNLLINEGAEELFTYPQAYCPPPGEFHLSSCFLSYFF
ncbi:hypothetical protein COLO4_33556 [Corchorus olitorius]|uniref:F-box domain-containing protein n=1 Tax=Corchorus olitorius TaxID=93759 RepID=A0A1R3GSN5_9ROSI|nr:hypothetical protein COLO4_33556 [Corchorus olitorius]